MHACVFVVALNSKWQSRAPPAICSHCVRSSGYRAEPLTSSLFNRVLKYITINYETGLCEKCCMVQEAWTFPIPSPPHSSLSLSCWYDVDHISIMREYIKLLTHKLETHYLRSHKHTHTPTHVWGKSETFGYYPKHDPRGYTAKTDNIIIGTCSKQHAPIDFVLDITQ